MSPRRILLVAGWGFSQLLYSPRSIAMGILAASPVFVALLFRVSVLFGWAEASSGYRVFSVVTATVCLPFVLPMLALFYASGIVGDDVEAGTLPYFLTRPIPRPELVLGRMIGNLAVAAFFFVPPFVLTFYLCVASGGIAEVGARFPTLVLEIGAILLALAAYNGLFSLAGTLLKRPLVAGLFFLFGWQAGAAIVPGAIRLFTVTHYLYSLMPGEAFQGTLARLSGQRSSVVEAILALVLIAVASGALAIARFRTKEL